MTATSKGAQTVKAACIAMALLFSWSVALAQALHVPIPPPLPAKREKVGAVFDAIFLGGAIGYVSGENIQAERSAYFAQLQAFLGSLTTDQVKALHEDPTERAVLLSGIAYLQATAARARVVEGAQAGAGLSSSSSSVFSASECIGAVVNGECHGSILPNPTYHPTCHGEMINGVCTGPLF